MMRRLPRLPGGRLPPGRPPRLAGQSLWPVRIACLPVHAGAARPAVAVVATRGAVN